MSMSEEIQKRAAEKPDKFTIAWWNEQFQQCIRGYQGATHAINRALADNEDLGKQVRELQQMVHTLYGHAEADRAKIGELQERMNKASEIVAQLKNGKAKP